MPNAVLAQSLEDELEGSLLGNARSQFPSAAFMPSSSHFFPPLPSFQVAFTIPSFNVSLDSLEVYLEMLHLLFFRLSMCLPLPALQMGSSFLPSPVANPPWLPEAGAAQNSHFTGKGSLKGLQKLPNSAWAQLKVDAFKASAEPRPSHPSPRAAPGIPWQGRVLHRFSHKDGKEEQQVQSIKTRGCQFLSNKTFTGLPRKRPTVNTDPSGPNRDKTSTGILVVPAPGGCDRDRISPELRLMLPQTVTTPNSPGSAEATTESNRRKILRPQDTLWKFYYIECKMQLSVK